MRYGRNIRDGTNRHTGCLHRSDCSLSPGAWSLHENVYLSHPKVLHFLGDSVGRKLGRVRRALPSAFEPDRSSARPGKSVPFRIGKGYDGIVESCLDMRLRPRHQFLLSSSASRTPSSLLGHNPTSNLPCLDTAIVLEMQPQARKMPTSLLASAPARSCVDRAWCGHWFESSAHAPAGYVGDGALCSSRFPSTA